MQLTNSIVVLDLETTGTWIEKDKIIEIAMIKTDMDGKETIYHSRVNPKMPIPKTVTELTGISDSDVRESPMFKEIAAECLAFLKNADLGGFNLERFDLPLLAREFNEAGLQFAWQKQRVFDAQKIFHLNAKRDLEAAYKFYCQKPLEGAHSALEDTKATWEILQSQTKLYCDETGQMDELQKFGYKNHTDFYDADRKFRWWNGRLYMMFGKYARRYSLQELVKKDRGYLEWVSSANFSPEVKQLVDNALNGIFPTPEPIAAD